MTDVKAIAIYLPQFHPIPENDAWWGKGFTEWTNVTKARPLFPGHYQPHLPRDMGFYDLRLPEVREAQAQLARDHSIHAFCYYHYWFGGQRLLERPMAEVLASGEPDFPFCLCWANENWTRAWDASERQLLIKQNYGPDDDRNHIRELLPAFADPRYLRIDGKIAFFVYRTSELPDTAETTDIWREEVHRAGLGELLLGEFTTRQYKEKSPGFDAIIEFVPNKVGIPIRLSPERFLRKAWCRGFSELRGTRQAAIHFYEDLIDAALSLSLDDSIDPQHYYRCVTPSWDNTARRKRRPIIFLGSSPEKYERWLSEIVKWTRQNHDPESRFIFINAWNEWAEGNHLEPDSQHGMAYLEATARAMSRQS